MAGDCVCVLILHNIVSGFMNSCLSEKRVFTDLAKILEIAFTDIIVHESGKVQNNC